MAPSRPAALSRVVSLESGVAMVVTDLHGDWDAYRRYRDRFLALHARGQADYLIFTGDLIHSDGPPRADRSLDILLDLLALREGLDGAPSERQSAPSERQSAPSERRSAPSERRSAPSGTRCVYLLGNHELPHLYGVVLSKGEQLYTSRFEAALGTHRGAILSLFASLPFYVRTRAGVSVCHAGAAAELSVPGAAARLFGYSHQRVLGEVAALMPAKDRAAMRARFTRLSGARYDDLARQYLAVTGADDPRYDDLLVGFVATSHPDLELLWAALFTRNELQYGERDYAIFLDALLGELSVGYHPQELLVTGHLACRGGYTLVAGRQLRLASGHHAHPRRAARYLLFDVAQPVRQADQLLAGLGSVF